MRCTGSDHRYGGMSWLAVAGKEAISLEAPGQDYHYPVCEAVREIQQERHYRRRCNSRGGDQADYAFRPEKAHGVRRSPSAVPF